MIKEIEQQLINNKDEKYQKFASSLLPQINNVLGVRLPILRKIAKEIIKKDYLKFINSNTHEYFELTLLEGMVISGLKLEFYNYITQVETFIPKINNWSVCDSFVCGLKPFKNNLEQVKALLKKYQKSKKEYDQRFIYVVLLNYFIKEDIEYVFKMLKKFNNEAYYAKMAAAWCLSFCFVEDFDKTLNFISTNNIHNWTLKKGITKAIESYKLSSEQKEILKKIR